MPYSLSPPSFSFASNTVTVMAEHRQPVGAGEAGRPAADHGDALAGRRRAREGLRARLRTDGRWRSAAARRSSPACPPEWLRTQACSHSTSVGQTRAQAPPMMFSPRIVIAAPLMLPVAILRMKLGDVDAGRAGLDAGRVVAEEAAAGLDQRLLAVERRLRRRRNWPRTRPATAVRPRRPVHCCPWLPSLSLPAARAAGYGAPRRFLLCLQNPKATLTIWSTFSSRPRGSLSSSRRDPGPKSISARPRAPGIRALGASGWPTRPASSRPPRRCSPPPASPAPAPPPSPSAPACPRPTCTTTSAPRRRSIAACWRTSWRSGSAWAIRSARRPIRPEALAAYIAAKVEHSRRRPYASKVFANELLHGAPRLRSYLRHALRRWVDAKAQDHRGLGRRRPHGPDRRPATSSS